MPPTIVSNNIASPQLRDSVNKAVCDGIGERLDDWKVVVYKAPDNEALAIRIEGPHGLRWNWTFYENEQTPDFIRDRVAQGILTKLSLEEDPAESTSD